MKIITRNITMRKIELLFGCLFICIVSYGQTTELSDDAMKHFNRAGVAIKMAETAEDYKIAVAEYEIVLESSPKDADVWYRLAVCYEAVAQVDKTYYKKSADAYRKAFLYGEDLLDEDKKKDLKEKIDEMVYSAELADKQKKEEISPSNLCGVWHFHEASGKTNDLYDIEIKENSGFYTVEYISIQFKDKDMNNTSVVFRDHHDLSFNDDVLSFTTIHNISAKPNGKGAEELYHFKIVYNYSLRIENGRLVGSANITEKLDAFGHDGYRRVLDAVKDGVANVLTDCKGDCGTINVYFTR